MNKHTEVCPVGIPFPQGLHCMSDVELSSVKLIVWYLRVSVVGGKYYAKKPTLSFQGR